jgi:AcrR family transcriptional regulator
MTRDTTDSRQISILQAATRAFATYGYRKTSMNDIADAAGMSRPAVYQYFRNKDDIFRRLVQFYYDRATEQIAIAFEAGRPVISTMHEAFHAQVGELFETLLNSPHGMELLDTGEQTAADIKEAGEERLRALFAGWLRREAEAGHVHLPDTPEQVADVILTALKGLKTTVTDLDSLKSRLDTFAVIVGKGLQGG